MQPDISVIIPTYNRPHILLETIKKVNKQSFKNFEIIIVDDNGIDTLLQQKTKQIVNDLNISNVSYYALDKNYGAPYARNFGASIAKGKYLAFLDDDDFWYDNKLEEQFASMENLQYSFCYCKQELKCNNSNRKFRNWFYVGDTTSKLIQGNFIGSSSNPLINKKLFKQIGGFDLNLPSCQDWDLWIRLIEFSRPIFLNQILVTIDRSPNVRISNNKIKVILGHLLLFSKLSKRYKKYFYSLLIFRLKIVKHIIFY